MACFQHLRSWAPAGITLGPGLLLQGLTKREDRLRRLERSIGGVWNWRKVWVFENGAALVAEGMFCR